LINERKPAQQKGNMKVVSIDIVKQKRKKNPKNVKIVKNVKIAEIEVISVTTIGEDIMKENIRGMSKIDSQGTAETSINRISASNAGKQVTGQENVQREMVSE
jgi:hypothetical protein